MKNKAELGKKKVSDIQHLIVSNPTTISPEASMTDVLKKMNEDLRTRHIYVVDDQKKLLGSIRMNSLIDYLFPLTALTARDRDVANRTVRGFSAKKASDIMSATPLHIKESDWVSKAVDVMLRQQINELPVVNDDMVVTGQLAMAEIIQAYLQIMEDSA